MFGDKLPQLWNRWSAKFQWQYELLWKYSDKDVKLTDFIIKYQFGVQNAGMFLLIYFFFLISILRGCFIKRWQDAWKRYQKLQKSLEIGIRTKHIINYPSKDKNGGNISCISVIVHENAAFEKVYILQGGIRQNNVRLIIETVNSTLINK